MRAASASDAASAGETADDEAEGSGELAATASGPLCAGERYCNDKWLADRGSDSGSALAAAHAPPSNDGAREAALAEVARWTAAASCNALSAAMGGSEGAALTSERNESNPADS